MSYTQLIRIQRALASDDSILLNDETEKIKKKWCSNSKSLEFSGKMQLILEKDQDHPFIEEFSLVKINATLTNFSSKIIKNVSVNLKTNEGKLNK